MKVFDPTEQQRAYDLIWSQMPHMQNRNSSTWWFFILFPESPGGYGPHQTMFSIASRAGERIWINDVELPGIDLKRPVENGLDCFSALSVGWYCDGEQVHKHLVHQPAQARLCRDGYLEAWAEQPDGERYGGEIRAGRDLSLEAHFRGPRGESRFRMWGDGNTISTSPDEAMNIHTPLGGVHFVAWRLARFEGIFSTPVGTEQLSGLGYFQRVCLNVPTFPWKWVWAVFPDGSLFSAYVPYVGLNLLRRGYRFFSRKWMESVSLPLFPGAFWNWAGPQERLMFDTARVTPRMGYGPHPYFDVQARGKNGDYIRFRAETYGHARFCLDRKILGGLGQSQWSYNEYMFRMSGLEGRIEGRDINEATMGQGYGNIEYTWGLGL